MLKPFIVSYIKHGNVCDYNRSEEVMATSEKMALKKFFNHREYDGRTRRQWIDYDIEKLTGFTYTDFKVKPKI